MTQIAEMEKISKAFRITCRLNAHKKISPQEFFVQLLGAILL